MRGTTNADALVRYNIESPWCIRRKAVPRIGAEIRLVIAPGDGERLCEFAWAGAKLTNIVNSATSPHQFDTPSRLECANQNEAVRIAFHQRI